MSKSILVRNRRRAARALVMAAATASMAVNQFRAQAADYTWDITPGTVGAGDGAITGGTGAWDATNGNWTTDGGVNNVAYTNALTDTATFTGTAGTVTLGVNINANTLTFGSTGYIIAPGVGTTLTFGGTAPSISVTNSGDIATINAAIVGSITKSGAGTLVLGGTNTGMTALSVNAGIVSVGAVGALGGGGINLNGGTLRATAALAPAAANIITIGASGGTIDNATATKFQIGTAGGLTGSGTLTRTASANNVLVGTTNVMTINVANTGFTGAVILNGGQNEISTNGLGSGGAGNSITINSGAELTANNGTLANPLTINAGGNIGGDNGTSTFSGPITVNGNFNIRLGDFYQATQRNLNINGPISGTGTFTLLNANSNAVANGNSQILTLSGSNSGYTSVINATAAFNIVFANASAQSGGGTTVTSNTTGVGGVGFNYDFGGTVPVVTNALTGGATTGGIFGINTALAATTTLNMSSVGDGNMFLGSQGTGTYAATTLGAGNTNTYRLGGGGGTLTLSALVISGNNNVVVGDTRTNGGGTVISAIDHTYTGTTSVNGGTFQLGTGGTTGSIAGGDITLGGGTLAYRRSDNFTLANKITATVNTGTFANLGGNVITLSNPANALGALSFNTTAGGVIDISSPTDIPIGQAGSGGGLIQATVSGTLNASGGARLKLNSNAGDIGAAAGQTLIINASIANGTGSAIDFFNSATGTVILNGANSYTGVTNIQSEVVVVKSINSVVGGTATSSLGAPTTVANGTINIGSSATSTLRYVGGGESTDRVINLAGTTAGAVLDQSGTGLLKFTSNFTAGGAGIKTLTLTGSSSGTGEIAGAIVNNSGTNTTSLAKTGTGTWTLSKANSYTGSTTIGGGNLILDFSAGTAPTTNIISATSVLTLAGGTLTINGSSSAINNSQTFASTSLNAGGSAIVVNANGTTGTVLNLGVITRAAGGSLDLTLPAGTQSLTNGITTTSANNAAGFLNGVTVSGNWAVGATTAGTTTAITAYTGYTPLTNAGGGTQATTNFLGTDSYVLTGAVTANSLKLTDTASGKTLDNGGLAVTLNTASGGLIYAPGFNGNSYTMSGAGIVGAGGGNEFLVNVAAGGTLNISSPLITTTANTGGTLLKSGPGTLVLSGTSAFTGNITVSGGVLSASLTSSAANGALGGPFTTAAYKQVILTNGGTFRSTALNFNDNVASATVTGFVFNIGSGGGTFDVPGTNVLTIDDGNNVAGTGTTATQLQGSGPLTKIGTGTIQIGRSGQSFAPYTGVVTVAEGTWKGGEPNSFGSGVTVLSGCTLDFYSSAFTLLKNVTISGTGTGGSGALINSSANAITLAGNVTLASDSSIGGSGTGNMAISGAVVGPFQLTKMGTGTVTLSGANTYSGGTSVTGGMLVFNNTLALPSSGSLSAAALAGIGASNFDTADVAGLMARATFAPNSFLALGSGSGDANVDFSSRPGVFLGALGAITYTGTFTPPSDGNVNLGGGGGTLTLNQNLPAATVTNVNIGTTGVVGNVVLGGTNTYTGSTTIASGSTLTVSSDSSLGAQNAALAINNGTLNINGTSGTLAAGGRPTSIPGGGTINVADPNNLYSIAVSGSATAAVTKAGPGALTVNGSLTTSSNINSTGTLNLNGTVAGSAATSTLAYGASAGTSIVNIGSGASINLFQRQGANNATSVAVWNQSGGTVTVYEPTADTGYVANLGYGYFNLTGGTFRDTLRFDVVAPTNAATGVVYIGNGGTLNNNGGEWMIVAYNGTGQMTVGPGGSLTRVGATNLFGLMLNKTNANGTLNIAGGTVDSGTTALRFGNGAISNTSGTVNLAGGTLAIGANASVSVGTTATNLNNTGYYNFAGGTLKFNAPLTAPLPGNVFNAGVTNFTATSTIFGAINNSAVTGAPSFTGGLTVDTNGFNTTFGNPLNGASGSGVTQSNISIPSTGNSGYVGAPAVTFSSTGVVAGGTPASGYALISGGAVTGIVITNPGTYAAGSTPSVTLTGGGGSIAQFNTTALNTANGAGGLTKIGNGTLTLANQNTYAGATAVNGGTLAVDFTQFGASLTSAPSNYINPASSLSMGGGTLTILGRANGAAASNGSWSGATTSPVLTFTAVPAGLVVGQAVTGTGIPAGAYIVSLNATTVTLNTNPTAATGTDFATSATTTFTSQTFNGANFNTNPSFIVVNPNGVGSGTVLNLGGLIHTAGGTIDFTLPTGTQSSTNGVTTTTAMDAGSQYGSWLTVNGGQLAMNDGNGNIVPLLTGSFTDIAARGPDSVVPNDPSANVRINSAGTSGNVTLASTATTIANLTQNTTTASTIDTAGSVLRVAAGGSVSITTGNQALTIGTAANSGSLTAGGADNVGGDLILGDFATNALTINAAITDNGTGVVNLVKSGSGTAIITGTSTYTGTTTIGAGTLQLGAGGTSGSLGSNTATINNAGTLSVNRSNAVLIPNVITGPGGFSHIGVGTTTLGGTNSYSGPTLVSQGTVVLTGDQNVSSSALTLGGTAVAGASSTATTTIANLDFSAASGSYASLTMATNNATANTITIGAGKNVAINGALTLGVNFGTGVNAGNTMTTNLTVSGAGSFTVNNPSATVNIGVAQGTQLTTPTSSTLNLSGLTGADGFSANVGTFNIGFGQTAGGVVALTNTSNSIIAATMNVGHSNGSNGGNGTITFGTGSNTLNVDTINLGFSKVTGTIKFASQTAGSPGTVTIANRSGAGGATLVIGNVNTTQTAGGGTGVLDLRGHDSTVTAGAITLGQANATASVSTGNGTISFDTGTFTAASLAMAAKSGTGTTATSTGNATGTLNIGGGTFSISGAATFSSNASVVTSAGVAGGNGIGNVNVSGGTLTIGGTTTISNNSSSLITTGSSGTLAISGTGAVTLGALTGATKTGTGVGAATANINVSGGSLAITGASFSLASQATAGTSSGTLSITGGTVTTNADIIDGGGAATTTITLNGGALNMSGKNIGSATVAIDNLNFQAGTLSNVAAINGTGGVNKTTAGTLTITGTNSYTGGTTVSAGTLIVNGSLASGVTVNAGRLGGSSTIAGPLTVNSGATLAPGNSPGTISVTGAVTLASGATYEVEVGGNTAGTYDQTNTSASTGTPLTIAGALVAKDFNTFVVNEVDPLHPDPTKAIYILAQAGSTAAAGTFDSLPEGATVTFADGSGTAQITYQANWGGSQAASTLGILSGSAAGNDVALYNVNLVPEPASLGLLGLAAAGLLARRRRRR